MALSFLASIAKTRMTVVALMVLASLTILPALLGWAGHRVNPKRTRSNPKVKQASATGGWQRWGDHVSKHAWPYMLSTLVLLVALTAPVLDLKLGFP